MTTLDLVRTFKLPSGRSFDMILVEGGAFMMGGVDEDAVYWDQPVHQVLVSSFYMGKHLVTQDLWNDVTNYKNPSSFIGDKRPVDSVTWLDARDFITELNQVLPGQNFRLPTEAEWEYAARGGNQSEGFKYAGSDALSEVGWYDMNSHDETKPVGLKFPNELGLYDMSGNIWEWVEDDWHKDYEKAPQDGSAWLGTPERSGERLIRGGSYYDVARFCRCACRDNNSEAFSDNYVGFRLALSL
jgi:formylglycine-generating enzyme required for sulfatase activity